MDFGSPRLNRIYVTADAATVRIDFDQPTDASSFRLLTANTVFELDLPVNKLHASTSTGTGTLYVIGVRD